MYKRQILNKDGITIDGKSWGTGTRAKFYGDGPNNTQGVFSVEARDVCILGIDVDMANVKNTGMPVGAYADKQTDNIFIDDCIIHDGANQSQDWGYALNVTSHKNPACYLVTNVLVTNCEIYNFFPEGFCVYISWNYRGARAENVTFRSCKSAAETGGLICNDSLNVVYEYCVFSKGHFTIRHSPQIEGGIGNTPGSHIMSGPKEFKVRHNLIYGAPSHGILSYLPKIMKTTGEIYGNIVFNNGVADGSSYSSAVYLQRSNYGAPTPGSQIRFYNNTIYAPALDRTGNSALINFWVDGTDATGDYSNLEFDIYNNIFYYDNAGNTHSNHRVFWDRWNLTDDPAKIRHFNNLYYRADSEGNPSFAVILKDTANSYTKAQVTNYEPSALNEPPVFTRGEFPTEFVGTYGSIGGIKPNTDYFVCLPGSNTTDAGAIFESPAGKNTAIDGTVRPQGDGYDIGAYER